MSTYASFVVGFVTGFLTCVAMLVALVVYGVALQTTQGPMFNGN